MIKKYFSIILASFFLLSVHNKGLAVEDSNIHPASLPEIMKLKEQVNQHFALQGAIFSAVLANLLANNIPIERAKEKEIVKTLATAANINLRVRFCDPAGVSNIKSSIASLAIVGTGRILDKTPAKVITERFNDLFSGSFFKVIAGDCLKHFIQINCILKLLKL